LRFRKELKFYLKTLKNLKYSFISLIISYKIFFIISSFIKSNKKVNKQCKTHGRLVAPDEIAAMAVYLVSDESRSTIG
jgi:hypothetical protein